MGRHFFEAITDISSDAESREEQNGASCFLLVQRRPSYGHFSKRMQAKRKKNDFFCYFEPSCGRMIYRSCLPMRPFESEFNGE